MSNAETARKLITLGGALFITALLVTLVICPEIDLAVSGFFYRAGDGFYLDTNPAFVALHRVAVYGGWVMGIGFLTFACITILRGRALFSVDGKGWLFLFLALMLGPVLLANVVLKDNWGRARPHTVTEFGGTAHFTPPVLMANECRKNCSFVAGDGAFGFFLPSLAYVVPPRRRRPVFWGTMLAGAGIGLARIAMGAHFFSDVIYAAFLMMVVSSLLHTTMYGLKNTLTICKSWIFTQNQPKG